MQSVAGAGRKAACPEFSAGLEVRRLACCPESFAGVSGHAARSRSPGRMATRAPAWRQQNGFLAKVPQNGEELKEYVIDMGDTYSPTVTMEISEDISRSESEYVPKAITMEKEVTENATIHRRKVNVTAEQKYSGLKDLKQILSTCKFAAENQKEISDGNHNDNTDDINQELRGQVFNMEDLDHAVQVPLEFETVPSSYEMPEMIYATIHKEHIKGSLTTVFGEAAANLEATGQDIARKTHSVVATAAAVAAVKQEEKGETFQTTNEVGKEKATPAVTRSRKRSTPNPSAIKLKEGILKTSSEIRQNEENVENFSTINLSKLIIESSIHLAIAQDDKDLISLPATSLNGEMKPCLARNGNQTSNKSMMSQKVSETIPSASQNESLPITTPMQYVDELESAHTDECKLIKKRSNTNHRDRNLVQENGAAENLALLSQKLMLEIMELQQRSLKDNPNQKDEVKSKSRTQSAKPIQGEENKTDASGNNNVNTEHVDFAAARKQWLMLEEISRTHSHRPPVKQEKNKTVAKHIIKEIKDEPTITKPVKREANFPHSASLTFSEDKVQSSTSGGIKIDEVECWRSSTNLIKKQDIQSSQENNGTIGDLDQNSLLNIADLSPCSEGSDSGLDDSTCRSEGDNLNDTVFQNETSSSVSVTHEKTETPIEREIRLGVKREESLRKARGIIKFACSEEYVEIKTRPLILQPVPSSSSKVKSNQFAEMQMQREILLERQREEDLVQQGKIKGTYDEGMIPEIEERRKFFEQQYPFPLLSLSKMFIPHINTPASLLVTPSIMKKCPSDNETKLGNVVVLENNVLTSSEEDKAEVTDAVLKLKYPNVETANVVILETPNLIIRRSSDFVLSYASSTQTDDTLQNNPFFKLRSHGSQSILSQEIKEVLQREEELRKQRCNLHGMAIASESSLSSSTAADNLSPGHKSNKNTSQDSPGTALGSWYMC
uniref:uncharacterized protein isoform X2 n=1 Tax=Pristiophorus japonicus TaxID=55135 RepID=UPI00398F6A58